MCYLDAQISLESMWGLRYKQMLLLFLGGIVPLSERPLFFKKRFYLSLERREKERERNTGVLEKHHSVASPVSPPPGTWPTIQECALTRNQTTTFQFTGRRSIHWATPAGAETLFLHGSGSWGASRPCSSSFSSATPPWLPPKKPSSLSCFLVALATQQKQSHSRLPDFSFLK